jgi:hypothetical protein
MINIEKFDEKTTPTSFLSEILKMFIKELEYIKKIQNYFLEILNIIPNLLKINDDIGKKVTYNVTEFIILITSIILITQFSYKNYLNATTIEGTIFIIFIILLIFVIIHTIYLYLFKQDAKGILSGIFFFIHKIPLYLIVFIFSFIVYVLSNIPNWFKLFFSGLYDLIIAAFSKFKSMLNDPEEVKILYKYISL